MKLPRYVKKIDWSCRPTAFDRNGCDGFFIRSMQIAWWFFPIALIIGFRKYKYQRLEYWVYIRQFFKRPLKRFKFYLFILLVLPAFLTGCLLSRFNKE